MYTSCAIERDNDENSFDSTLEPYSPVQLTNFSPIAAPSPNVRGAINTYLDSAEEDEKVELLMSLTQGLGVFLFSELEAEETTPYSRGLEAVFYARLQNEGIKSTTPDTADPNDEDVVLNDVYVHNLEILLQGQTQSLGNLLESITSLFIFGNAPSEIEGDGHLGLSADIEARCDAWVLEALTENLDTNDAINSEDPQAEAFLRLFADFTLDYEGGGPREPRIVDTEEVIGTLSGVVNLSVGLNFFHFNFGSGREVYRIPFILSLQIPEFTDVDVEELIEKIQDYVDVVQDDSSEQEDVDDAYKEIQEVLWGSTSVDFAMNLLLGDGNPDPIKIYSGQGAMNLLLQVVASFTED